MSTINLTHLPIACVVHHDEALPAQGLRVLATLTEAIRVAADQLNSMIEEAPDEATD